MARTRPISANQLSLLDLAAGGPQRGGAASLAWDGKVRALLAAAIKACRYSREQIAERMTSLSGEEITRAMLDSWTAPSKNGHRFPLSLLPAFSEAAEDREILRDALALLGSRIATREDLAFSEIGRLHLHGQKTRERERALRVLLEDGR